MSKYVGEALEPSSCVWDVRQCSQYGGLSSFSSADKVFCGTAMLPLCLNPEDMRVGTQS